jgi:mannose-6-phosphate isomerase-like protein (cupin superfamily)
MRFRRKDSPHMTTIVPEQRTAVGCHRRGLEVILASAPAAAATVVGCAVPPATSGPALHVHDSSDETFLVLAGVLLVRADGQVVTIPEGGLVRVSHGVPHTFATTPGSPACFLLLHAPGESGEFPAAAHAVQGHAGRPREQVIGDPESGWPHVDPVPAAGGYPCRPGYDRPVRPAAMPQPGGHPRPGQLVPGGIAAPDRRLAARRRERQPPVSYGNTDGPVRAQG